MLDLIVAASAAAATPLAPGALVTTYLLGDIPRCARVTYVDTGADQRPWAWIVGGHAPQWALHVPVKDLAQGCVERQQEAKR